jgi:hypothetical protein
MTVTDTDFDDLYGSKYFSAADLNGGQKRVKIGKTEVVALTEKNGSTKRKCVLLFEGEEKGLVVNKTNATKLGEAYGRNFAAWVGKHIELYSEPTQFGAGVRVRPLRKPATPVQPDPDLDDFIPF